MSFYTVDLSGIQTGAVDFFTEDLKEARKRISQLLSDQNTNTRFTHVSLNKREFGEAPAAPVLVATWKLDTKRLTNLGDMTVLKGFDWDAIGLGEFAEKGEVVLDNGTVVFKDPEAVAKTKARKLNFT